MYEGIIEVMVFDSFEKARLHATLNTCIDDNWDVSCHEKEETFVATDEAVESAVTIYKREIK